MDLVEIQAMNKLPRNKYQINLYRAILANSCDNQQLDTRSDMEYKLLPNQPRDLRRLRTTVRFSVGEILDSEIVKSTRSSISSPFGCFQGDD